MAQTFPATAVIALLQRLIGQRDRLAQMRSDNGLSLLPESPGTGPSRPPLNKLYCAGQAGKERAGDIAIRLP